MKLFKINDTVMVSVDLSEGDIKKGDVGVVVQIFKIPKLAYEVEFCNAKGETINSEVLSSKQITLYQ